jgi:two-component system response regulator YesN
MLQLLIVEDEAPTRDMLVSMIDWETLGIRICGQAENGLDALELLKETPADLVLTDIRMPLMDGLQLVEEIRRREYPAACILLSGYSDFDYAQRAMRLGVSDFLVKPCSPKEIRQVFDTVARRIMAEKKQADTVKGLERQLHNSMPLVKSQLLRHWLHTPALATENRPEMTEKLQMTILPRHIVVIALRFANRTLEELNYSRADMELLQIAAANITQETLEKALAGPVELVTEPGTVLVILNGVAEWLEPKLLPGLETVRANLSKYLKIAVTAGISEYKPDLNRLSEAYEEALEALELRFYKGVGQTYFHREASHLQETTGQDVKLEAGLWKWEESAFEHMKAGLFAEALNDTEQWLTSFPDALPRARINRRTIAFLNRLLQLVQDRQQMVPDLPNDGVGLQEQVDRIDTLEELSAFVYQVIRRLVEVLNPQKKPKRKVQQALDLIAEQYASPALSLAGVAKTLFVSSTSLSTLFKQELGINFLDYVHQYRIEKAKALLQSGDRKIQTVAKEVGYFDEAHFTKTFKKWTGQLPSQYRKQVHGL